MSAFFEFQGKQINYNIEGQGPAVVLLHGFLENLNIWNKSVEVLSLQNKVISIDLPGHGKSEVFSEVHTMEFMADIVMHLLNMLGIKKAHIIGHSMGGYVSLAFAKKYSEVCKSITLFHSHAAADSPEAKINRARAAKVVNENKQGFIANFIPDLFSEKNRVKFKDEIQLLKEDARQTSKEGVIAALYGMREREDMIDFISKMDIPILFIIGKKDIRADINTMKEQIILPKESHSLILQDVAHMGYIENFEKMHL